MTDARDVERRLAAPRMLQGSTYEDLLEASSTGILGVLQTVRWHWVAVLLTVVPIVVGAVWVVEQLPAEYEATGVVLVEPRAGVEDGPTLVRLKAPTYVSYLTARSTLDAIGARVGQDGADLDSALTVDLTRDTGNLTVAVEVDDPEAAADIVTAVAEEAVRFSRTDPSLVASVVAPPAVPDEPSGPARTLIEAAAAAVALGLGLAIALLLDQNRPRVRDARSLSMVTGASTLGRIPGLRGFPEDPLAAFAKPEIATAVRTLRVHVEGHLHERSAVTVTSSTAGEGKTSTSILLAASLARLGVHVLLVDADVVRPRLSKVLHTATGPGLLAVLRGEATIDAAIRTGPVDGLDVLTTTEDAHASDLLSRSLDGLLRELRGRYDLVLLDAPPLGNTDEARSVAVASDAVILVSAVGTSLEAVAEASATLASLRVRLLGTVLNRARRRTSYYGTYGSYAR